MKKKMTMVRTTVYLPERVHRGMKVLAALNGKSMADLLREALEEVYKDDMTDLRRAREAVAGMRKRPETTVALEDLAKRR
jgi:predicted DNA-binding protein